jgi:hypothetical protein
VVPLAAALAAGLLVTGCGGAVSSAIKSLAPSASVPSISVPSRSPRQTAAAQPTAQQPAASAAAQSPAASSSGADLIWLWVALGAIVLILLIVLIARSGRRRGPRPAEVWQARAVDAYAQGSALYDAMRMAEAPGALVAQDAAARWADIQRRADDLGQALYAMREAAPDEDKRMRTAGLLAALQSVRSVMAAERGADVTRVPPPELVRSRLMAFGAALQELRATDERMPY